MRDNINILGIDFSKKGMEETINIIEDKINSYNGRLFKIITGNPEIVLKTQKDKEVKRVMKEADLITADGVGIVLASKWKGNPVSERVTGVDLLQAVLERGNEKGWSFYFLGTDEETNKKAVENVTKAYPNLRFAGRHNGYFNASEELQVVEDIAMSKPDILAVALGAPRAEMWIDKYKDRLCAKVSFGVGGSLDVLAGKVKRSPEIWIKLRVEWLYRLLKQPSRWRRQLVLPVFAYKSLMEALKERIKW